MSSAPKFVSETLPKGRYTPKKQFNELANNFMATLHSEIINTVP